MRAGRITSKMLVALVLMTMSAPFVAQSAPQGQQQPNARPQPQSEPQPSVKPPEPDSRPAGVKRAPIALEVDVVVSRYQGDKKISSLPYTLAVNANLTETQLNMGTDVPVPTNAFTPAPAGQPGNANPLRTFNYRSVGTSISCRAGVAEDGRFELQLSIDDSSVYTSGPESQSGPIVGEMPVFRNFRSRNTLLLRDGQSRQYTAATDRVSGEVVKVDVTLRVVK